MGIIATRDTEAEIFQSAQLHILGALCGTTFEVKEFAASTMDHKYVLTICHNLIANLNKLTLFINQQIATLENKEKLSAARNVQHQLVLLSIWLLERRNVEQIVFINDTLKILIAYLQNENNEHNNILNELISVIQKIEHEIIGNSFNKLMTLEEYALWQGTLGGIVILLGLTLVASIIYLNVMYWSAPFVIVATLIFAVASVALLKKGYDLMHSAVADQNTKSTNTAIANYVEKTTGALIALARTGTTIFPDRSTLRRDELQLREKHNPTFTT